LRQTDNDLAEHGESEDASVGFGTCITQPIADEQERRSGDDGWFRAAFVENPDDEADVVKEKARG
jgi:hypothetical protein